MHRNALFWFPLWLLKGNNEQKICISFNFLPLVCINSFFVYSKSLGNVFSVLISGLKPAQVTPISPNKPQTTQTRHKEYQLNTTHHKHKQGGTNQTRKARRHKPNKHHKSNKILLAFFVLLLLLIVCFFYFFLLSKFFFVWGSFI